MSATVSWRGEKRTCYAKAAILAAVEEAFGLGAQASFQLIVDGHESIIVREAMRAYCAEPKPVSGGSLKPRPMAEAPLGEPLIAVNDRGGYESIYLIDKPGDEHGYTHFYTIADLLNCAEILAAITPEGYEYIGPGSMQFGADGREVARTVYFRKLAPPVRYKFEGDGLLRMAKPGDFVIGLQGELIELIEGDITYAPQLCFRRVEVQP